ncbi:MAG: serine protease Do [Thermoanaerobacterium sp.]|jgi:PDZ domain (Also known as DHR or GLGF)./Trypsin.|uniref:S1C family serine protease n=1 Tax=Thermoanaerobacterium thermosaccharolyticum TaxID=1517 RepID=UPI0024AB58FD|nr:serine protease Do [Thermoanaerobacterium sp.]MDK2806337.1 serine protease Do [Thermoanaerobacterium sp.]MDN5317886.1 serine protease Do [Thermoanaerobacterium sp.]
MQNGDDRRIKRPSYLTTVIIIAVITSFVFSYIAPKFLWGKIIPVPYTGTGPLKKEVVISKAEPSTIAEAVAEKDTQAVVGISSVEYERQYYILEKQVEGVGSGFIVDKNGYILTNNHVASPESEKLTIYLSDGSTLPGKVLWSDSTLDLSVVKINAKNLPTISLGDSDKIVVGQTVIAIGNPLGLRFERTVTSGIISALNRSLPIEENNKQKIMEDLIQTDASINPGNSGGPLVDAQGKAIGINTAKVTTAEGLGFAIPINIVKPIINKVIATGTFKAPYLGIVGYDREIASYINADIVIAEGIYVADIDPSGPAQKAGIKKGYILLEVDGKPVDTMVQLKTVIYSKNIGDKVSVKYRTLTGNIGTTTITLGK